MHACTSSTDPLLPWWWRTPLLLCKGIGCWCWTLPPRTTARFVPLSLAHARDTCHFLSLVAEMPGCRMYVPPLSESPAMSARSQLSTNLATRLLDCESRDHSGPPPQSTRHSDASHSARGAGDGPLGGGGGQVAVLTFQQTRGVGSMLDWCWFSVVDDGPKSARHWASASCLLCFYSLWITANAWHSPYVALMSGQGLQRWSRIKAALGLCLVFASLVLTTDPENSTSWA